MKPGAFFILALLLSHWFAQAQDIDSVLSYNRLMAYDTAYFSPTDPIAFLDSLKVYPVPPFSVLSPYLELRRSTVAREAAFIIYGFRTGIYPPTLNSSGFRWTKEEIVRW